MSAEGPKPSAPTGFWKYEPIIEVVLLISIAAWNLAQTGLHMAGLGRAAAYVIMFAFGWRAVMWVIRRSIREGKYGP